MGNNVQVNVKTCTKCGESKPLTDFGVHRARRDGLRSVCKPCNNAARRGYYKANPERVKEYNRVWEENNRDKVKAYKQDWERANPEKVLAAQAAYKKHHPNRLAATKRAWRQRHPERMSHYANARRSRRQENGVFVVTEKEMVRLYASPCAACGSVDDIQADHIIPIARGGHHSIGNLQPLCQSCNASKRDSLMVEWRARLDYVANSAA